MRKKTVFKDGVVYRFECRKCPSQTADEYIQREGIEITDDGRCLLKQDLELRCAYCQSELNLIPYERGTAKINQASEDAD